MIGGAPRAVVTGAGHAGIEAAAALARMGCPTLLVTLRRDRIARMSCNPSVGGLAKGHVVHEVDALGGLQGGLADAAGIQFRRLNLSKGPAVRSTRVQADLEEYSRLAAGVLNAIPGLHIIEDEVLELRVEGGRIAGVRLARGGQVPCRAVVLTTGTFLGGRLIVGGEAWEGGRLGEPPARGLTACLRHLGFEILRLKTGTPPRLRRDSVDLDEMARQDGDEPPPFFHWATRVPRLPQVPCWVTATTPETHAVIRGALDRSPLYTGRIAGIGPRYCPSIEDKVVRFPDRDRHQVFIEPLGIGSDQLYPAGISTSLPRDVQEALLRTIPGLRRAQIEAWGYAIEYDAIRPTALGPSLEAREVGGLFAAGQINGTSGYEEAAGQGLLAGINAARSLQGREPVIFARGQAYIGVMVDDLTSLGVDEPYRLFTSRAEHRLLLREANADRRLTPLGREAGLVGDPQWAAFEARMERFDRVGEIVERTLPGELVDPWARARGSSVPGRSACLRDLIQRPEIVLKDLRALAPDLPEACRKETEDLEAELKFGGYIRRQEQVARRLAVADGTPLPADLPYGDLEGLSAEIAEKLGRLRPGTLGAASRVPGVTPAALAALLFHVRKATSS